MAIEAKKTASDLKQWCQVPENLSTVDKFVTELKDKLSPCFQQPTKATQRLKRENIWGAFHRIRTSTTFTSCWAKFLHETTGATPCPIFFQNITTTIFTDLVHQHFPIVVAESTSDHEAKVLSYEEKNALRYVAGYIPHHLTQKLAKSAHPLKEELTLCLMDLLQEGEVEVDADHSSEWVKIVDRGGLKHANNAAYDALVAMELVIRKHLSMRSVHSVNDGFKEVVMKAIMTNEDVQFYWTVAALDWDEEESAALLQLVVDLFVTVRGFAFISAWMELYKQETKKSTQKSKGVRKRVLAASDI